MTSDMLRTVYAEVKVNVPFSSHPIIVKLQKLNDLNLGTHHHDKNAAKIMALFISEKMHTTLIPQIASGSSPLSLIVDTTTDYKGNHYLISFLRAIEQDMDVESQIVRERPVIYFYKLIEFGYSENAPTMLNLLDTAFDRDDKKAPNFKQSIKNNLIGFG